VGIVAVEKRRKTGRNFSEVTNAFKNGMCYAVNVIFRLAGYRLQEEGLIISRSPGDDSMSISSSNGC